MRFLLALFLVLASTAVAAADGDGALEILAAEGRRDTSRVVVLGVRGSDVLCLLEVPYDADACATPYVVVDNSLQMRCGTQQSTFAWNGLAMRDVAWGHASERHDPSCPPLRRIARLMKIKPGKTVEWMECGAGKFPRLATVVLAEHETAVTIRKRDIFILDGERVIARHVVDEVDEPGASTKHELLATGDLDGDGIDELVMELSSHWNEGHSSSLIVFAVRGGTLKILSIQPFSSQSQPIFEPVGEHDIPPFEEEDTLACHATVKVQPHGGKRRGAELVVTRTAHVGAKVPKDRIPANYCTADEKR